MDSPDGRSPGANVRQMSRLSYNTYRTFIASAAIPNVRPRVPPGPGRVLHVPPECAFRPNQSSLQSPSCAKEMQNLCHGIVDSFERSATGWRFG
jgi:hypothetical protein